MVPLDSGSSLLGLFGFEANLAPGIRQGRRIDALDGSAILGKNGEIKPQLGHCDPVALGFKRVGFPGVFETCGSVFSEFF